MQNLQINIENLASISDIEFKKLADNAGKEAVLGTIIFLVPFSIALSLVLHFVVNLPPHILIPSIIAIVALCLFILWWTVKAIQKTGLALRQHDFVLKTGVFWRKVTVVPFNRIQHIELHKGPLERKFNLATIKLYTAGGSGVDLAVGGLEESEAQQLRQFMLNFISKETQNEQ